jgi:hypothetical protein
VTRRSRVVWLTDLYASFYAAGIERAQHVGRRGSACWLGRYDPLRRPCEGRLEICHAVNEQRVRNALYALLPDRDDELLDLAAWDPRLAIPGCEGHHRRFDRHLTPSLVIPRHLAPASAVEWAGDWGLESQLDDRFPSEAGGDDRQRKGSLLHVGI